GQQRPGLLPGGISLKLSLDLSGYRHDRLSIGRLAPLIRWFSFVQVPGPQGDRLGSPRGWRQHRRHHLPTFDRGIIAGSRLADLDAVAPVARVDTGLYPLAHSGLPIQGRRPRTQRQELPERHQRHAQRAQCPGDHVRRCVHEHGSTKRPDLPPHLSDRRSGSIDAGPWVLPDAPLPDGHGLPANHGNRIGQIQQKGGATARLYQPGSVVSGHPGHGQWIPTCPGDRGHGPVLLWDGQHRHRRRDGPLLVPGPGQHHERH
ncbi:uncharacterized protein METZ01_LOCUS443512, partial [marine metagenome]